ncbi:hypothetical protein APY03_2401 [Variovorax sp. WDL1]|nr:hypothetical protein APY03_2401 [Variovorax sp. WDL1]
MDPAARGTKEFYGSFDAVNELAGIAGLHGDWAVEDVPDMANGKSIPVPPVASYLTSGQGEGRAADELKTVLRAVGLWNLGQAQEKERSTLGEVPRYRDYVAAMWEMQRLMSAMEVNELSFAPSMLAGQQSNHDAVCARELASVRSQSKAQIAYLRDYGGPRDVAAVLSRIRALKELAAELEALLSDVSAAADVDTGA